ncbi:MAG: TIGR02266 family protein [Deltaproteobacteria bacterium]|nr:TIGR02266 family protein [Deltaproteobacteria bacterium]
MPLEVEVDCRTPQAAIIDVAVNISRGGIFIRCPDPPLLGEEVTLTFVLLGGHRLRVTGSVVWSNPVEGKVFPRGIGVEFTKLGEREQELIERYVEMFADKVLERAGQESPATGTAEMPGLDQPGRGEPRRGI